MASRFSSPVGRVRLLGMIEGTSMLVLLFVTMPLKYLMGMREPNLYVGMAHGFLFLGYVAMLLSTGILRRWPLKLMLLGILGAIVPFGPFVYDRKLGQMVGPDGELQPSSGE